MEIVLKGLVYLDIFTRDLHDRLNGSLRDLPSIISQMGIRGEDITIYFHGIASGEVYFQVSVMDDPQNPKVYECGMMTGSMIDPYYGFYCKDGKTTKDFSWNEKDKKLEILCEYSLTDEDKGFRVFENGKPIEISDEQEEENAKKFLNQIYSEQDDTWKNHLKKVWKETRRVRNSILKGEICFTDDYSPGDVAP